MSFKKALPIIILFVLLGAGLAGGLSLIANRQLLPKKASVPEGIAIVRLDPSSAAKNNGEILSVQIFFDSNGVAISGITVKIVLTGSGGTPFKVIGVQPNTTLAQQGLDYRPATFTDLTVDIYAVSLDEGGFTPSGEVSLATISLLAQEAGTTTAAFDPVRSMITKAGPGGDILLTPQSTGTYTVAGGGGEPTGTPTPTPTSGDIQPTNTPTLTPAPTSKPAAVSSPAPQPTLPVAGSAVPTMGILLIGLVFLTVSGVYLWAKPTG